MFQEITVDALCERIIDYRGKTPEKSSSGVRLITAKVVKGGKIYSEPAEYIPAENYDAWMRRGLPQQWDVLITTEAPLGEVAILLTDAKVALGQRLILLRGKRGTIDQRFLLYVLQSPTMQARLAARATGTTVAGIKQAELRKVLVPVPPLATQRRIASILSAYDDLIENNERRIAILEDTARRIFREWFVEFRFPGHEAVPMVDTEGGRLPEGGRVERLEALAADTRDAVQPSSIPPETPYLGLEHMPRRSTTLIEWGRADEVVSTKLRFRSGDVLFGKIRPYFHKVVFAQQDGVCSSDIIVMRSRRDDVQAVIGAVASSDEFVAHATQTSNGTKMPRANWSVLSQWLVPMPPAAVLQSFNSVVLEGAKLSSGLAAACRRLRASRDLLLPRLISGELSATSYERVLEAAE